MSVKTLSASNLFASPVGAAAPTAQPERQQAKVWANIGFRTVVVGADGEQKEVFIQLPFGQAIDTMAEIKVPRKDGTFKDMVSAQNALLEQLKKKGLDLPAGESMIINGLEIQLVHVSEETPEPSNNIIIPDFG